MLLIGRMPDSRSLIWSQYGDGAIVTFSMRVAVKRGFRLGLRMSICGSTSKGYSTGAIFIVQDGKRSSV